MHDQVKIFNCWSRRERSPRATFCGSFCGMTYQRTSLCMCCALVGKATSTTGTYVRVRLRLYSWGFIIKIIMKIIFSYFNSVRANNTKQVSPGVRGNGSVEVGERGEDLHSRTRERELYIFYNISKCKAARSGNHGGTVEIVAVVVTGSDRVLVAFQKWVESAW